MQYWELFFGPRLLQIDIYAPSAVTITTVKMVLTIFEYRLSTKQYPYTNPSFSPLLMTSYSLASTPTHPTPHPPQFCPFTNGISNDILLVYIPKCMKLSPFLSLSHFLLTLNQLKKKIVKSSRAPLSLQ